MAKRPVRVPSWLFFALLACARLGRATAGGPKSPVILRHAVRANSVIRLH
jgi:hypothetical protein